MFRETDWKTNFEGDFSVADNDVHTIVSAILSLKPRGHVIKEVWEIVSLLFKRNRNLGDTCKYYNMDEKIHRSLLNLIMSLLIRSPANRHCYEAYPQLLDMPPDEDTGKANMRQNYQIARHLCETGSVTGQRFVLLHSPLKKFVVGDGYLDWLTPSLTANRINGRALVPLTPRLCVYFCTPRRTASAKNCASFYAPPWMVEEVNEISQIYSRDKLFYLGRKPKITEAFRRRVFLEHSKKQDRIIDMLNSIVSIDDDRLFGLRDS